MPGTCGECSRRFASQSGWPLRIDQCRPHRETVTADGCKDVTVASADVLAGELCEGTVGDISYLPEKASRENRRRSASGRDQASPI
jgi:hypothetical protein